MELVKWLSDCSFENAPIEFNGKIKRFSRNGTQSRDAWCIGWSHRGKDGKEIQFAIVGDWSTGEKFEYKPFNGHLDPADYAKIKENARLASEAAEREREKTHEETARRAGEIWEKAARAGKSDYLKSKGLEKSFGARFDGATLIIPCRDGTGTIWGIQRISADGQKRFLTGQRKKGCYHLLHENFSGPACRPHYLFLSEGFATAASIVMALDGSEFAKAYDYQVLCAFDSANLEPVAAVLRDLHPTSEIVIAADDDRWEKDGTQKVEGRPNVGIEKARHTAKLVGGRCVVPKFADSLSTQRPTDFNDLHRLQGIDSVEEQLLGSIGGWSARSGHDDKSLPVLQTDGLEIHEEPIPASPETKRIGPPPEVIKLEKAAAIDLTKKGPIAKMTAEQFKEIYPQIIAPYFRKWDGGNGLVTFEVTNPEKKELRVIQSDPFISSRIDEVIHGETKQTLEPGTLKKFLDVWQNQTIDLRTEPLPFTWADQDEWCHKKLDFSLSEGPHSSWDEFLVRLSNADEFMAFVWSIFEMKNRSRQFLYLYDPAGEGGKSTVIGVLGEIFGNAFTALNNSMVSSSASRWLISTLYGKRLVAWADCKNPKFCMSETVRNITSGDNVMVEFKGKAPFATPIYLKLIIGSNLPPEITGAGADTSRLLRIDVKENTQKNDSGWVDRLRSELPHFLWACRKTYERLCGNHGKILLTDETRELVMESSGGTEGQFDDIVAERMDIDPSFTCTSANFIALCQEYRMDNMAIGNFKEYLTREHRVTYKRTKKKGTKTKITRYQGFKILSGKISCQEAGS